MKNIISALCLTLLAGTLAFGQTTTTVGDDYKKAEGYIGYSNGQIDTGVDSGSSANAFFRDRRNFHGVEAAGVYNFSRYLGFKGDVSGTFNGDTLTSQPGSTYNASVKTSNSLYNFLGGIQVKDNAKSGTFKPFAHALVGAAHSRNKVSDYTCSPTALCPAVVVNETFSSTGLAGAFGGGLDIRASDRFQIRAFQIDYNPTRVYGATNHNLRIGAGIVF